RVEAVDAASAGKALDYVRGQWKELAEKVPDKCKDAVDKALDRVHFDQRGAIVTLKAEIPMSAVAGGIMCGLGAATKESQRRAGAGLLGPVLRRSLPDQLHVAALALRVVAAVIRLEAGRGRERLGIRICARGLVHVARPQRHDGHVCGVGLAECALLLVV